MNCISRGENSRLPAAQRFNDLIEALDRDLHPVAASFFSERGAGEGENSLFILENRLIRRGEKSEPLAGATPWKLLVLRLLPPRRARLGVTNGVYLSRTSGATRRATDDART